MKRVFLLLAFFLFCGAASAGEPVAAQVDVLYTDVDTEYDIDAEGRVTTTRGYGARILHERVLENQKTRAVSYSRSIQAAEILEAYTQKADGQRVAVPKDNYQTTTHGGHDKGHPFFSDIERITVVFPDTSVGDTVYLRYRVRDTESIFPGSVSLSDGFSPFSAIESGTITLRAPQSLPLTAQAHHLEELPARSENGIVTRQWRYQNPQPRVWDEELDYGIWKSGDSPSLYASTFKRYAEIAQAYAARALPKAEPDERIRAQAARIVGEEKDAREQARLLYEWVSTQISYAGNCIGLGAVVPRDLAVVLENKMGDCKDKATLLQALLTAQGIASEQALININSSSRQYDLPQPPVVEAVDHVMNYLPQWDLYVDATAENVSFGYLPVSTYGRPVIHTGAAENAVRAITAAREKPIFREFTHTTLKLAADGSASGSVRSSIDGTGAAAWRAGFMDMKAEQRDKFVENLFQGGGRRASGALETSDLSPALRLSDHFEIKFDFQVENLLHARSGAFLPFSLYGGSLRQNAGIDNNKPHTRDAPCYNTMLQEVFEVTLEPGVQLLHVPESMTLDTPYLAYESKVQKNRQGLRIERTLHTKTPTGVCSAAANNAWRKDAAMVAENLRQEVLYKRGP
jgi:transglutaminase-like putative cysteine protease